jgi:hypothetical protein
MDAAPRKPDVLSLKRNQTPTRSLPGRRGRARTAALLQLKVLKFDITGDSMGKCDKIPQFCMTATVLTQH